MRVSLSIPTSSTSHPGRRFARNVTNGDGVYKSSTRARPDGAPGSRKAGLGSGRHSRAPAEIPTSAYCGGARPNLSGQPRSAASTVTKDGRQDRERSSKVSECAPAASEWTLDPKNPNTLLRHDGGRRRGHGLGRPKKLGSHGGGACSGSNRRAARDVAEKISKGLAAGERECRQGHVSISGPGPNQASLRG